MRKWIIAAFLVIAGLPASAAEVVGRLDWGEHGGTLPAEASVRFDDDAAVLVVEHRVAAPVELGLAVIEAPALTTSRWALVAQVRTIEVSGRGHLEMWSCFAGGDCHFTRTLAENGPLAVLSGSSEWRRVVLPFVSEGAVPERLELRLVLPSSGTIELSGLDVVQYAVHENPLTDAAAGAWWSPRIAGLAGGFGGTVLGLVGALVGSLASRGRARQIVLSLMVMMVAAGIPILLIGLFALTKSQPHEVWFPLLLGGGLSAILGGCLMPVVMRGYEAHEQNRMRALDL